MRLKVHRPVSWVSGDLLLGFTRQKKEKPDQKRVHVVDLRLTDSGWNNEA